MGLGKHIVEQLLALNSAEKKQVELRLLELFGAYQTKTVTDLRPRRGGADGGIDGRIKVVIRSNDQKRRQVEAAINVKVEKKQFSRERFGGFTNDMDREKLCAGIIVTAAGLSPDASDELERHNNKGTVYLVHFALDDVLSGNLEAENMQFADGELAVVMRKRLTAFLTAHTQQTEES